MTTYVYRIRVAGKCDPVERGIVKTILRHYLKRTVTDRTHARLSDIETPVRLFMECELKDAGAMLSAKKYIERCVPSLSIRDLSYQLDLSVGEGRKEKRYDRIFEPVPGKSDNPIRLKLKAPF